MTEKDIEAIKKKSLYSVDFSPEYKVQINQQKINELITNIKNNLIKNNITVIVMKK
jgi:hypothetical protein